MNNSILTRNEVLAIAAHMAERTTRNNSPVFAGMRLSGVDLSYITLEGIDFEGANLKGANFTEAKLENVNFEGANLKGANFTSTKIKSGNFEGANLEGVLFRNTTFEYVRFQNANLQGADCRAAHFHGVYLTGANLKSVNFDFANGICVLQLPKMDCIYAVGGHNGTLKGVRFYVAERDYDARELQKFINDSNLGNDKTMLYLNAFELCMMAIGTGKLYPHFPK